MSIRLGILSLVIRLQLRRGASLDRVRSTAHRLRGLLHLHLGGVELDRLVMRIAMAIRPDYCPSQEG